MDHLTIKKRSWNMSLIRAKNTRPEILVRSAVHRLGFRFRTHKADLPGKPDIVLPKYKSIIFVHGCFWHQHKNCRRANIPKTNKDYWLPKLERNLIRDKLNQKELKKNGWKVCTVWECQTKDNDKLLSLLKEKLKGLKAAV